MAWIGALCQPEVLYRIVDALSFYEIKQCRLVSASWNETGVEVMRSRHSMLEIHSYYSRPNDKIERINCLLETSFQPLPFSALRFSIISMEDEDGPMSVFMKNYGWQIRKLELTTCYYMDASSSYNNFVCALYYTASDLTVLTVNIWPTPNDFGNSNLPALPNLRRLYFDLRKNEKTLQQLIERAPNLKLLSINAQYYGDYSRYLRTLIDLPKICVDLPRSTKVRLFLRVLYMSYHNINRICKNFLPIRRRGYLYSGNWTGAEDEFY